MRQVTFLGSCGTNMDNKKFRGKMAKSIKRSPVIQALHQEDDTNFSAGSQKF
jgi:hypothetical protein